MTIINKEKHNSLDPIEYKREFSLCSPLLVSPPPFPHDSKQERCCSTAVAILAQAELHQVVLMDHKVKPV